MTTKYNVGDEFTLKVKVANIFTDRSGTTYMVKVIANNGENLAGIYMNYDEKTLENIVDKLVKIPESYPMTTKEIEERIASSDDGNYLNNLYNEARNALKNQGIDYALEWAKAE